MLWRDNLKVVDPVLAVDDSMVTNTHEGWDEWDIEGEVIIVICTALSLNTHLVTDKLEGDKKVVFDVER